MFKALIPVFLSLTFTAYSQSAEPSPGPVSAGYSNSNTYNSNQPRPNNIRIPAEWEEAQAVIIAWPHINYNASDNPKVIAKYTKAFNAIWTKLASAIQEECQVWIKISAAEDSIGIKKVMAQAGTPLKHYKFLVDPGENFWVRDYGPISFYYGAKDSIGIIDANYLHHQSTANTGDEVPALIAQQMNAKVIQTPLFHEAGNFDTDGQGNGFFTSRMYRVNINQNNWENRVTLDTMRSLFNLKKHTELRDLPCDGGTGHIDMFFKLLDEQTIALAEYPKTVTSSDRDILEENFLKLSALTSVYNKPYQIFRVPMATSDNGEYNDTTCEQLNRNPRTYMNGLFVNRTYILPVFSDDSTGNSAGDAKVVETFKKLLPGYKIIPIDSRILALVRGGLHCTTMQVPAENPIQFIMKKFPDGKETVAENYPVEATILNKDYIRVASVQWRKKGETEWTYERMTCREKKNFSGAISGENYFVGDTIEYYIKAKSYNGKQLNKPITAPVGFNTFVITSPLAQDSCCRPAGTQEEDISLRISPAPAQEIATISFILPETQNISITITDMAGREVETLCYRQNYEAGKNTFMLPVAHYRSGVYVCVIANDRKILRIKKFSVQH
ncbi:MAG: agmatine deiminase family protein [Bacteroidota bacterium]